MIMMLMSVSCDSPDKQPNEPKATTVATVASEVNLPEPYATKSVYNFSKVIGWPQGRTPSAPEGFAERMARRAVELSGTPDGRVRAVTHLDVSRADIDSALQAARDSLLP